MPITRRHILAAAAVAPAILTRPAYAFPRRPIRLVVSSAPAASLDTLARVLAPALSARLGQPVVVENQGGANGLIAMQQVARVEPDGHTLLVTGDAIVLAELTLPQAGFTVRDNFTPVVQAVRAAQILATHPGAPFSDIAGYIAAIRARPGAVNVGIPSQGGIAQVAHELLSQQLGGLPVEFVSYRGGGPAILDLIARNTDALVITLPAITEQVRQGAIRPLAVTTARRDPALPDVPTLAESVAPGFDVESWQGILAPAATPPAVVARLHEGIAAALRDSTAHTRLTGLGFEVVTAGPEEFRARAEAATARFAGVVRRAAPAGQGS